MIESGEVFVRALEKVGAAAEADVEVTLTAGEARAIMERSRAMFQELERLLIAEDESAE